MAKREDQPQRTEQGSDEANQPSANPSQRRPRSLESNEEQQPHEEGGEESKHGRKQKGNVADR